MNTRREEEGEQDQEKEDNKDGKKTRGGRKRQTGSPPATKYSALAVKLERTHG